jgi:hypothetical protein
MLAWAKAIIAKPIAAAVNAKSIFCFIGEPSSKSQPKPYAILANEICDGDHKKSLFYPEQSSERAEARASDDTVTPRPYSGFSWGKLVSGPAPRSISSIIRSFIPDRPPSPWLPILAPAQRGSVIAHCCCWASLARFADQN